MNLRPLIAVGLLFAGLLALVLTLRWMRRKGWVDARPDRVRRGTGHALLGLQEFIEPSVEHIFETENREEQDQDDRNASEDDPKTVVADLMTSLGRTPVDPEEVRRHLASAQRVGLDWQAIYEMAVRDELAARPFRAPSLPPSWRVAPREASNDPSTGAFSA